MKIKILVVLGLLWSLPAYAQHEIEVTETKIEMHHTGDFAPRMASRPGATVLRVLSGETVTLATNSIFDAVEVQAGGVLQTDPTQSGTLRVTDLQILPGGLFKWHSQCGRTFTIFVRGTPINPALDPFQWSRSILTYGRIEFGGCMLSKTWSQAATDLKKGDTSIVFPEPATWLHVGDELLIPDMEAPPPYETNQTKSVIPRERPVFVTGLSADGLRVTLSKPLDFDHLTVFAKDSAASLRVLVRPYVAVLTRNLVIESEEPDTAPGHVAVMMGGTFDVQYVEFKHLGRTKAIPIDLANFIGKYAFHIHMGQGFGSVLRGASFRGRFGQGKVAVAIHGSSDGTYEWNVGIDFDGAGMVTEKGNEVRNRLLYNFMAYMGSGNLDVRQGVQNVPPSNDDHACAFCDGGGYWFKGLHLNTVDFNVGINNRFGGIILNFRIDAAYPSVPGGPKDASLTDPRLTFASFRGDQFVANAVAGLDLWGTRGACLDDHPCQVPLEQAESWRMATIFRELILVNNWPFAGLLHGPIPVEFGGAVLLDSVIQCADQGGIGSFFAPSYTFLNAFRNVQVLNCGWGIAGGGARNVSQYFGGTWANRVSFYYPRSLGDAFPTPADRVLWIDVTFKPFPGETTINPLTWLDEPAWLPKADTPHVMNNKFIRWPTGEIMSLQPGEVAPPPPPPPAQVVECNDGVDNDHDGKIDFPFDLDCEDKMDNKELGPPPPPPPPPPPVGPVLTVTPKKSATGTLSGVMAWSGLQGALVDIFVNGKRVITTANDGAYTRSIGKFPVGTVFKLDVCQHDVFEPRSCPPTATVIY